MKRIYRYSVMLAAIGAVVASCSTTEGLHDGEQLYVGMEKIKYENYVKNDHFTTTQAEMEAALACAPNGALFGSSYYRTPFPYGLWIWNEFSESDSKFAKWMTKTFGKAPVLMSWVNPELRASVAQSVLRAHGYFHGKVDYEKIKMDNPKKGKIGYTVNMGDLMTIDTINYVNFPPRAEALIDSTRPEAQIHAGDPFDVSTLDAERNRLSTLFRNNGYYYYQPSFASYLADTIAVPGKARLRLQLADNIPEAARRKWYIGRLDVNLKKTFMEQLDDSVRHRHFTVHFNGKNSPIRTRVILRDLKLRPRQLYSYDKYSESASKISSSGLFSMVDFKFTPRDSSETCDTLDLALSCVFDKPYDFYVETNYTGKTTGLMGPGLIVGFAKRNAFRGGEKLSLNLKGSYEWQTGHRAQGTSTEINSYEYGGDVSLELPRLLLPFLRHHRFYNTPSTVLKASTDVINRSSYFKRHVVSGELTYNFQPSATSMHQFSPLIIEYDYMQHVSEAFSQIMEDNPYLMVSMQDQFIPKMRYTYIYTSPLTYRNPIYWQTTVSESANLLSLGYSAFGQKWSEKNKEMFKNPFAQFFKFETEFRKTWSLSDHSQLVGHLNAGVIWSYGNSDRAPYNEQFYVGGANSIRAFTVRSIGPGSYYTDVARLSYVDQTGDMKFLGNLEYRARIFGNLYGAAFLDAGNVWAIRDDGYRTGSQFKMNKFLDQLAVGTGIGIRYDMDFVVLRLDWGIGIHLPYDTGKSGYYNIPNFKDGQSIHLAIGYPF